MDQLSTIISYLEKDALGNITLLKMIECYGDQMRYSLIEEQPSNWGILLLLPTSAAPYDQALYSNADYIVFLDYTSDSIFLKLLQHLPHHSSLIFKLHRDYSRIRLADYYQLVKQRAFYSYTLPAHEADAYSADIEVQIQEELDERLLPLWAGNNYSRQEIEQYYLHGAVSFTIFEKDQPVSTALTFRNHKDIWEIGAVYTVESRRGDGLGKRTVGAALQYLKSKQLIARYHVLETNAASIALAKSLGLVPFVKLEHLAINGGFSPLNLPL